MNSDASVVREEGPARRSPDALQLITSIGSPIALGTALLLYFGWVRSQAQAAAFGADVSVFEMSPQDLVLRSIDVLFFPIILFLLAWLLLLRLDPILRARADKVAPFMRHAWVLAPLGLVPRAFAPSFGDVTLPLWVLLAIGGTAYGNLLRRHAMGQRGPTPLSVVVLVVGLLTVTLFWQTERLARLFGEARAEDLKDNLAERLPAVWLFSSGSLHLDLGESGVTETVATGPDIAYPYRYVGLYFLQRSGGKYFLLTDGWRDGSGRLLVVADTESVRLEFGVAPATAAIEAPKDR